MTVMQLIRHLMQYDPQMRIVYQAMSDYHELEAEDLEVVKGVGKPEWVMRVYDYHIPTMSEKNRANIRDFLCFPGN